MNILITGGSGLLGRYLRYIHTGGYNIFYTYKTHPIHNPEGYYMDLLDKDTITHVFEDVKPEIIIHTAAIGSVDYCEKNILEAYEVIVDGTRNVIEECKKYGSKLVYISSNAVFDGEHSPYSEMDFKDPINWYGKCKSEAEGIVENSGLSFLIVRPILLYGWPHKFGRKNWVNIIVENLSQGNPVNMVYDTLTQPTYAKDCAEAIWNLVMYHYIGTYNIGGDDRVSLYAFALKVAEVWGYDLKLIKGVSSDTLELDATRPRDTTYDLTKMHAKGMHEIKLRCFGIQDGLQRMRGERNGI